MEKNITPDSVISALMNHTKSADSDFPVHVFPAKMQRIILELNTTCAFPIDYAASAMLAAISVAIGNTHRVEVKRSWQESAIVYIAIVGRPGDCKSHPLTFVMRPLVNADWKNNQEFQKKHCEYQQAVAMSRKERISAGLDEFPKEPKRLRYLVSDVTQEGLSANHSHNPRGLCLWVDELSAWFKNFTRYNWNSSASTKSNRAKAHKNLNQMAQTKISNPQSSEMTDMSNNSIFTESMENPTTPEVQPIAEQSDNAQPKSSRPTAKQRKSDLEDYHKAYFGLIKLGKDNKHQVAISNDTFDRVERIARFFGGPGYSVSNFVEHIINEHPDSNSANYESWFTLISKSF